MQCSWFAQWGTAWSEPRNWSPSVPGPGDEVIIPADPRALGPSGIPAGASVASLTMAGNSLVGQLLVRDRLNWTGGMLYSGIQTGPTFSVEISGSALKQLGGPLEFLNGRISDANVELFGGAAVTSKGNLECRGVVRFTVSGGAPPTFTNSGTMRVLSGTTSFDGVYFLGRGAAEIAAGANLALSALSVIHLLSSTASVTGPGVLRVTGESSLFVEKGAVFSPASVVEFTRGNLASKHQGDMAQSVLGQLGEELLATDGTLRWNEGIIYGALRINKGGTLQISGSGAKSITGGSINISAAARIDSAGIDLTEDALFTNEGSVTAFGDVRLSWPAGGTPFFTSSGVLSVAGTMTVWDVVGLLDGVVEIAAGAALVLQSQTAPSFLLGKARVRGGGTLRVTEGRLHAVSTARIEHGTTFELARGGSISPPGTPVPAPATNPAPAAAKQGLVVDGLFHWTGGTIYGDVTVGKQGVLSAEGSDVHGHAAGTLRLSGSGAVVGPARLEVEQGMLLNEADLLIQGPIEISTGSTWQLVNRGTLRVTAPGVVTVGNNILDNRGLIDVQSGILHLTMAPGRMSQRALGTLNVAAGSTVRSDAQLFLDGSVTGSGTIEGDLQVLNKLAPGSGAAPGRLTINGSLMLGAASTTDLKIASGTDYSSATSSGQLSISGTVATTARAITFAASDRLEILGGAMSTVVAGRFTAGRFPAPAGGRYLHVSYVGEHVLLEAGSNAPGFDLRDPPPAGVLNAWVAASPYRWIGYYLHSPCHSASWMGSRPLLTQLGLGIAVIYVGQQMPFPNGCGANDTTAGRGTLDGVQAIARTAAEGFPPQTWIYLDVEHNPTGIVTPGMLAYIRAWVDQLLTDATFNPAIYLHQRDVAGIDPTVTSAFQAQGRPDRARYWCTGGPRQTQLTDPTTRCGVPEAAAWQQQLDFQETFAGQTLQIDRSVSWLPDPSAP